MCSCNVITRIVTATVSGAQSPGQRKTKLKIPYSTIHCICHSYGSGGLLMTHKCWHRLVLCNVVDLHLMETEPLNTFLFLFFTHSLPDSQWLSTTTLVRKQNSCSILGIFPFCFLAESAEYLKWMSCKPWIILIVWSAICQNQIASRKMNFTILLCNPSSLWQHISPEKLIWRPLSERVRRTSLVLQRPTLSMVLKSAEAVAAVHASEVCSNALGLNHRFKTSLWFEYPELHRHKISDF